MESRNRVRRFFCNEPVPVRRTDSGISVSEHGDEVTLSGGSANIKIYRCEPIRRQNWGGFHRIGYAESGFFLPIELHPA